MSNKPNQSTVSPSDADTATTSTASTPKKLRSANPNQSVEYAKCWPFQRVDGKLLERAHRQLSKQHTETFEEAPF